MSKTLKMQYLEDYYPEILVMDGFDDCIIGVCVRFGQENIAAYDQRAVICKLMEQGMDQEEATEYFEFNQLGAGMGERTPCFVDLF